MSIRKCDPREPESERGVRDPRGSLEARRTRENSKDATGSQPCSKQANRDIKEIFLCGMQFYLNKQTLTHSIDLINVFTHLFADCFKIFNLFYIMIALMSLQFLLYSHDVSQFFLQLIVKFFDFFLFLSESCQLLKH